MYFERRWKKVVEKIVIAWYDGVNFSRIYFSTNVSVHVSTVFAFCGNSGYFVIDTQHLNQIIKCTWMVQ